MWTPGRQHIHIVCLTLLQAPLARDGVADTSLSILIFRSLFKDQFEGSRMWCLYAIAQNRIKLQSGDKCGIKLIQRNYSKAFLLCLSMLNQTAIVASDGKLLSSLYFLAFRNVYVNGKRHV